MTPERWQRVKAVLGAALETPPAERAAFVQRACGADHELRREVESLLASAERGDGTLALPPAAAADAIGEMTAARLRAALADRYALERELGRGGMATVYLARDRRHHRPVALKVLHPELGALLGAARFRREIETAANLSHPHILPVFDSGEVDGLLYYVMPYVEGQSLRERLRAAGAPLPIPETLRIVREVADALAYAHRHAIVHRDIKPENVLLDETGHARVADFGIARAVHHATTATDTDGGDRGTLTQTGIAIGTPAYMSPEQALGDAEVDGRSDVYSLACVAFELLAGAAPFSGSGAEQLGRRLTRPPPSLRAVRPALPPAADAVLARGLAVAPDERYATAPAFADALADALAGTFAATVPSPSPASTSGAGARRIGARAVVRPLGLLVGLVVVGALAREPLGRAFRLGRAPPADDAGARTEQPRVAVLPFENLGDSADAYFVDGVADEVRGKLAEIHTLQVIARASSNEYRRTRKHPEQIARELGVEYLLTGTVRSARGRGGRATRVRVSPELVRVSRARKPVTVWQRAFDAELADVFTVQTEIAQQVANGLDLELGAAERSHLAEQPTSNLAAYDAYLQGEQAYSSGNADNPAMLRAIRFYERAVALDPTFTQAWARLGQARGDLAHVMPSLAGMRDSAVGAIRRAIERAPSSPVARLALGRFYMWTEGDPPRALEQFSIGLAAAPNDVELLAAVAWAEEGLGRWDAAIEHFRRAVALDPRALNPTRYLGLALLLVRRYPEARVVLERALALAPADLTCLHMRATLEIAQGDLAAARATLRRAPREVDPAVLRAFVSMYYDLGWMLDDAQQRLLLASSPAPFGGDRAMWGLMLAQMHGLRGDVRLARAYADSARMTLERAVHEAPTDPTARANYAVALAYLGRREPAIREGRRAVSLGPMSKNAFDAPYIQHQLARIYLMFGEQDAALDALEPLLRHPYVLSPGWLRVDPTFDPLRGNPRFQRLLAGAR